MISTRSLWVIFGAAIALTAAAVAGLLLPTEASPGYLAGMAALLVVGMTVASIAKVVIWTRKG